ncbi:hypothetical protein FEE59_18925 [Herbaspirillum sp. RU 5E]|nr:hypothetical protein [Herbaspirillum sp. RU 5E]
MKKSHLLAALAFAIPAASVYAEVPAQVNNALKDAQTDGVAVAGAVLAVIVAISAFKYIRRAL